MRFIVLLLQLPDLIFVFCYFGNNILIAVFEIYGAVPKGLY